MTDCLSCVPLKATFTAADPEQDLITEIAEISPLLTALPFSDFKDECKDCSELATLQQVILAGWPKVKRSLPEEMRPYFLVRHELATEVPLIFRGTRLVVPKSLQERVVHLAHKGHQGMVCTKPHLRELYWWPYMDNMVNTVLSSCPICQACKLPVFLLPHYNQSTIPTCGN